MAKFNAVEEERIQAAITAIREDPELSIAAAARQHSVPRRKLSQRISGRASLKERASHGHKLSWDQEKAICNYIDRLDRINLPVRRELVVSAANYLLAESWDPPVESNAKSPPPPPTINSQWASRFIKRHKYSLVKEKVLDAERRKSEDKNAINSYFLKLKEVVEEYGIQPCDIWNMDETGFQIGVGKSSIVITKRRRAHYFALPTNRESATAVEAISAAGDYVPAFLILSGSVHMARWYGIKELDSDTVIGVSPTGYTNDMMTLDWIKHFDTHTRARTRGAKRLLLMDGYGSHHTIEFIKYCNENDIIPFGFPPHSTHILQPLDVVVFQPLKHYHAKALDLVVREGCTNITKLEFLGFIQSVRKQAFKHSTILSAFKKTGIYPYNPQVVLEKIRDRGHDSQPTTPPFQGPGSSPFATPTTIRKLRRVAWRLQNDMNDLNREIQQLTGEASPLERNLGRFVRGALTQGSELLQTKRDLGLTQLAQQVSRARRQGKNSQLQTGGIITVKDGRRMVERRQASEIAKAVALVEAANARIRSAIKKGASEAGKKARRMRNSGQLHPAYLVDGPGNGRLLKRV